MSIEMVSGYRNPSGWNGDAGYGGIDPTDRQMLNGAPACPCYGAYLTDSTATGSLAGIAAGVVLGYFLFGRRRKR